ncbi:hypothetical protein PGT21_011395 [Puccinia graminis f. sp. tritici]|uniref:Uncharacterized protein n=1 Tax=Puccinia graminis f. sp. tritici TaxID=56615 RepID=A0A5B0RP20_PUCGR|nr:hypothetical protein PGT21_011395 [Puccinia graminis f. sp. tritici]KAA1127751.1 hypothetical protein PGTUg99_001876 [Puccinia graminis f. sp. tritici]
MAQHRTASLVDGRTRDGGVGTHFLLGTITKIVCNEARSRIDINLDERLVKEEEEQEEDGGCGQSTSNGRTSRRSSQIRQPVHRIRFLGAWCRTFLHDLKTASKLKLDMDAYEPEFDQAGNRWVFRNGVRVELLIDNPFPTQLPFFLKTVDLVPRLSSDLLEPPPNPKTRQSDLQVSPHIPSTTHSQQNLQASQRTSRVNDESASRPTAKRTRVAECDPQGSQIPNRHDRTTTPVASQQGSSSTNPNSHQRAHIHSNQLHYTPGHPDPHQSSTLTTPTTPHTSTRVNPTNPLNPFAPAVSQTLTNLTPASHTQALPLKTLDEIDQMEGGTKNSFNLIAFIEEKKTEECERSTRGMTDYKMTLYLRDSSRPMSTRNVTCNLFWKTLEDCPPWGKAMWKVIFLFNVFKRASTIYDTQIVGPSNGFQWALWSPGYTGSAEQFFSNNKSINQFCSLFGSTPEDLKAKALALFDHQNQSSLSNPYTQPATPIVNSIPKTISELTNNCRQKFDLCVQVVDLWVDGVGSDRMTVTDYTRNSILRSPKPISMTDGSSRIVEMHVNHGGDETNWGVTESRVMTVYIEQPILQTCYEQFVDHSDSLASRTPNAYDYRTTLINKVVRLSQLDLRLRAGSNQSGVIYALIANPRKSRLAGPDDSFDIDPDTRTLLADRIVPLAPSEPAYRKLLLDKEIYIRELEKAV